MCRSLLARVGREGSLPEEVPAEVRALFQDWLEEVERELGRLWPDAKGVTAEGAAARLAIPIQAAAYVLVRLARR